MAQYDRRVVSALTSSEAVATLDFLAGWLGLEAFLFLDVPSSLSSLLSIMASESNLQHRTENSETHGYN